MGSWNNTCGLTNLPIHEGEAVYVFPIKEKDLSGYRSHCYSTAFYRPMITPFVAEYNDYGGAENCTGLILNDFINEMKRTLVEMDQGDNQYHDIPIRKDEFDIDKFFEAVHEDRLYVDDWTSKRPVYFTMIRKDVVDRLWNEWTFDIYVGEGKGTDPNDCYERNLTYAIIADKFVPKLMDTVRETIATTEDMDKIERYVNRKFAMRGDEREPVMRSLIMSFENHEFWDAAFTKDKILESAVEGNYNHATELLKLQLIGVMVNEMMESTRRVWLPVMHQGSQSAEHKEYRLLHKLANDVIDARDAEYAAEYGEDYDD